MKNFYKLLTNSKVNEVYALTELIIDTFNNFGIISDTSLAGIIDLLKIKSEKLKEAIAPKRTKSDLKQKDKIRKDSFRAIVYILKGYVHHPDEEKNLAANNVYKVFKKYGTDFLAKSYAIKGGTISSLLTDLSESKYQNDIDALSGLRKLIDTLAQVQNNFDNSWVKYLKIIVAENERDSATKIAKETVTIINKKLIMYLQAMIATNGQEYEEFAMTVSKMINDNNEQVKKRSKPKVKQVLV